MKRLPTKRILLTTAALLFVGLVASEAQATHPAYRGYYGGGANYYGVRHHGGYGYGCRPAPVYHRSYYGPSYRYGARYGYAHPYSHYGHHGAYGRSGVGYYGSGVSVRIGF